MMVLGLRGQRVQRVGAFVGAWQVAGSDAAYLKVSLESRWFSEVQSVSRKPVAARM